MPTQFVPTTWFQQVSSWDLAGSGSTRSAIPIVRGWTRPEHPWAYSRNSCDTRMFRPPWTSMAMPRPWPSARRTISEPESTQVPLQEVVKSKLQKCKEKSDYCVLEARKHWYHLRRAIDAVVEHRLHPGVLPYRIIAEYQRNRACQNSVDLFLEDEEQLR
jgi:hypothetical protein